ncbi:MAG: hypothetical protein ABI743_07880, partial [bacterium]
MPPLATATLEQGLHNAGLPFVLSAHVSLPSTQEYARNLVTTHGPGHWVVITADQPAGRGRMDRRWVMSPGDLAATFVLPIDLPPERWGKLGLLGGLAAAHRSFHTLPRWVS